MRRLGVLLFAIAVLGPLVAWSRVGGGQTYSGSRSSSSSYRSSSSSSSSRSSYGSSGSSSYHSGSSSGGGDAAGALFSLVVLIVVVALIMKAKSATVPVFQSSAPVRQSLPQQTPADELRAVDPTFSEPVFLEWATLLFIRGQKARGGSPEVLSPWFDDVGAALPKAIDGRPITEVQGVVVGAARLASVRVAGKEVWVDVAFRACTTTVGPRGPQAWYLEETWAFRRAQGVASRVPEDVEKLACPACGSPFERDPMGRCPNCSQELRPGAKDWAVAKVTRAPAQTRPPLLTGNVEEEGTSLPSIRSYTLVREMKAFADQHPGFSWPQFEERARAIFLSLQDGWTRQKWETLRPLETETVFQSHRFWMEEYAKQGLRNRLEDVKLARVEVVKVSTDACYEAVTCRMHASMRDSTIRVADGVVVGGDAKKERLFTEYWTFLRRPGAEPRAGATFVQCPSCGAPQKISQAGVCEYCNAKVTSGRFGWVLSRIDQDEEYQG